MKCRKSSIYREKVRKVLRDVKWGEDQMNGVKGREFKAGWDVKYI